MKKEFLDKVAADGIANIARCGRHNEKMFNLSAFTLSLSISSNSIIYCPISDLEMFQENLLVGGAGDGDVKAS